MELMWIIYFIGLINHITAGFLILLVVLLILYILRYGSNVKGIKNWVINTCCSITIMFAILSFLIPSEKIA